MSTFNSSRYKEVYLGICKSFCSVLCTVQCSEKLYICLRSTTCVILAIILHYYKPSSHSAPARLFSSKKLYKYIWIFTTQFRYCELTLGWWWLWYGVFGSLFDGRKRSCTRVIGISSSSVSGNGSETPGELLCIRTRECSESSSCLGGGGTRKWACKLQKTTFLDSWN